MVVPMVYYDINSYILPYGTVLETPEDQYPEVPSYVTVIDRATILKSHLDNVFMEEESGMKCTWYVNEELDISEEEDPSLCDFLREWNDLVAEYRDTDVRLQMLLYQKDNGYQIMIEKIVGIYPESDMRSMSLDDDSVIRLLKLYADVNVYDYAERTIWS